MKTSLSRITITAGVLLCLLFFSVTAYSQSAGNGDANNQKNKKEMIQAQKVAFITRDLNLNSEEAEKFWPLYNEFQAKKEELARPKRELEKAIREQGPDKITDKQAEDLMNALLDYEQGVLDLKKVYVAKYKAVIGIKKTVQLFHAEKKFNDMLLRQLKNRREPGPGDRP
jgi:predicted transcriptional regulator